MDATKLKTTLMLMKLGESRSEYWFLQNRNFTTKELADAVSEGLIIKTEKDPKDFMSDMRYTLTKTGYEFAWQKNIK